MLAWVFRAPVVVVAAVSVINPLRQSKAFLLEGKDNCFFC